ncbi:hypothetical protein ANRL1_01339 [Anaerolineae bacterium]|nr:hypothetical protein ANRL1_01339 [Anaerolineae bacterium]
MVRARLYNIGAVAGVWRLRAYDPIQKRIEAGADSFFIKSTEFDLIIPALRELAKQARNFVASTIHPELTSLPLFTPSPPESAGSQDAATQRGAV